MQTSADLCPKCNSWKREEYPLCYKCGMGDRGYVLCKQCGDGWHSPKYPKCFKCNEGDRSSFNQDHSATISPEQKKEMDEAQPAPLQSLLFLDTETTGFNAPRLVQLAYAHSPSEQTFNGLFRPPMPIEEGASKVHGIVMADLMDLATFEESEERNVLARLLETSVFVAHNASYDISVLNNEGLQVPFFICTCKVARKIFPFAKNFKLQGLREEMAIVSEGAAHDAMGDIAVMMLLFHRLVLTYMMQSGKNKEQTIQDFITFSR